MKNIILSIQPYDSELTKQDGNIAPYTRVNYYKILRKKLEKLSKRKSLSNYKIFVNNLSFDEKKLAAKLGVNQVGLNSLLYHRNFGSRFVIGFLVKSNYSIDKVNNSNYELMDFCKTCKKCMKNCPSQAINSEINDFKIEKALNKEICLQYLLTKNIVLDLDIVLKIDNKLYGCDVCQNVCPLNKSVKKYTVKSDLGFIGANIDLDFILNAEESDFNDKLKSNQITASFVERSVLKRNALINIFNSSRKDKKKIIEFYKDSKEPLLKAQAEILFNNLKE